MGRSIRSGANGYITWNIALDTEGGPTYNNVNNHCTALVHYDADTDDVIYGGDYYALGHFSKYINSGAVMLESTDTGADSEYALVNTVFQNTDGSKVAVVTNTTSLNSVFKFVDGNIVREITVPARGIITLVW
jgi:glucosylceramidase